MHIYMHIYIHTYICAYIYTHIYIHRNMHIYIYIYIYIYTHRHIYIYMNIYMTYHRTTRRSTTKCITLEVPFNKKKTQGDRGFSHTVATHWNKLPEYIRQTDDISIFRRLLKTYYFRLAYET